MNFVEAKAYQLFSRNAAQYYEKLKQKYINESRTVDEISDLDELIDHHTREALRIDNQFNFPKFNNGLYDVDIKNGQYRG